MINHSKRLLVPLVVTFVLYILFLRWLRLPSLRVTSEEMKEFIQCNNKNFDFEVYQSGSYWILKNFIKADHGPLECYESITYTTTSDIRCLENVIVLAERWKAPISLALYTPNYRYNETLNSVFYLRNCLPQSSDIRKYVTFHMFFDLEETPDFIWNPEGEKNNCDGDPPYAAFDRYAKSNETFPINVGRNIASSAALTHFHLRSDLELMPSDDLVPKFFEYIDNNRDLVSKRRRVFILPTFEISSTSLIPRNMEELQDLLSTSDGIFFYDNKELCIWCFQFPNKEIWVSEMLTQKNIKTHFIAKRIKEFKSMEHFYIGREHDPLYPEELTWNTQNDKMAHEYAMCLIDYEYYFLAGGFLVHTPGFHSKKLKKQLNFNNDSWGIFSHKLKPLYHTVYGTREGCVLQ